MKKLFILTITIILLANCSKDESTAKNACNSDNPMEEINWLKAIKDSLTNCTCQMSIVRGTYRGQPVFYLAMTDPLCDGVMIPALVNCNGKTIKQYTEENYLDFYHEVTRDTVLYNCKN